MDLSLTKGVGTARGDHRTLLPTTKAPKNRRPFPPVPSPLLHICTHIHAHTCAHILMWTCPIMHKYTLIYT